MTFRSQHSVRIKPEIVISERRVGFLKFGGSVSSEKDIWPSFASRAIRESYRHYRSAIVSRFGIKSPIIFSHPPSIIHFSSRAAAPNLKPVHYRQGRTQDRAGGDLGPETMQGQTIGGVVCVV